MRDEGRVMSANEVLDTSAQEITPRVFKGALGI
jgi:hypothetical protein